MTDVIIGSLIGSLIGVLAGAALSSWLSNYLWKKQFDAEQNTKKEHENLRRFNYINDLIIEAEQNMATISAVNPIQPAYSSVEYHFNGFKVGNILRFENNYHQYFLFNKENRKNFFKLCAVIWERQEKFNPNGRVIPYSLNKETYDNLKQELSAFIELLNQALNKNNDFNF